MTKQQYPEPIAAALIFNPAGEILLIQSHKWKNKYVIPAGHIELGEKIKDALKREVKEETGLTINQIEFICLHQFIFDHAYWKKRHFISFNFAAQTSSRTVKLNSEAQKYIWVSLQKALKLPVAPYTIRTIKKYLKSRA
ncbi:NUDIX domain-containing protein [Patescibacteria group bacterium]|nr:NUDIX domain-containing protein [Patescibacteria group bacterium]